MNKNYSVVGKRLCICLVVLAAGLLGYGIGNTQRSESIPQPIETVSQIAEETDEISGPALKISVVEDAQAEWGDLLVENAADVFTKVSLRSGIARANLEVNGTVMPLGDALERELITQEEIACFARLDARNGYCVESHETRNGLTHFTYQYPEFNLRVVYDVYVTPDGGQDLINQIIVFPAHENEALGAYLNFHDPVTGLRTDLEDWGIIFTVEDVSPTGITVQCQQSGGQQIGQLCVDWYFLLNTEGFLPELENPGYSPTCDIPLNMNGQTSFTLDWADIYGELPSGTYQLTLNVKDHFDPTNVHPLMQDFHDWQAYDLDFAVS